MINIDSPEITMSSRTSLLSSKLAVRDSFDDDELSDDADDEVFIQDGRNGVKHDDERGVKRPLMPPRRKAFKSAPFQSNRHRRAVVRALWAPCCYAGLFLSVFLVVIGVVVLLTNSLLYSAPAWTQQRATELLPPSVLVSKFVWNASLPRLMSESNLYLHDVNNDGTQDVVLGYGTAVDRNADPGFICAMYYHSQYPCYGGVVVLNGKTGQTIWQHWSEEAVFAVDCGADITGDGINDCLATGKNGLFCAVNGRDGSLVWHLPASELVATSSGEVFSPRFMADVDGDHIEDVIASHTGNTGVCGHAAGGAGVQGHLLVLSGASGQMLQCVPTPNHVASFTAPQVLVWPDGGSALLVGTGGPRTPGGLYVLPLHPQQGVQLARSQLLYHSPKGGVLTPALLVDITGDSTEDIVVAMFDSTVMAFDGISFNALWNFSIPSSELHSPISAGYFNEDDIPDMLVRFHVGPGFPSYHYSQTQVLDGRTGKPLLSKPLSAAPSSDNAPSLSVEGHGNDAFLVWAAGCLAHESAVGGPLPPAARDVSAGADWDRCDPKFNSTSSDLKLITQHVPPPGIHVFHTEESAGSQQAKAQEDFAAATSYIDQHPDFWDEYATLLCSEDAPVQPVASSFPSAGQEQNEDVYLGVPHQVRKHGRPYPRPESYQDYDSVLQRPQDEGQGELYSRTGRQIESAYHKTLSSHLSAGIVAPRLEVTAEGLDLIFTSHWSVPRETVLPAFQQCLANELSQYRENRQRYVLNCSRRAQMFAKTCWTEATQLEPSRPFAAARMAHMVVHRVSLQLQCKTNAKHGQRCAGILPWSLQSLAASPGSSLFHTRSAGVTHGV